MAKMLLFQHRINVKILMSYLAFSLSREGFWNLACDLRTFTIGMATFYAPNSHRCASGLAPPAITVAWSITKPVRGSPHPQRPSENPAGKHSYPAFWHVSKWRAADTGVSEISFCELGRPDIAQQLGYTRVRHHLIGVWVRGKHHVCFGSIWNTH